ncbi:MAG: ATP-binding cassette domain-containing protein [Inhella sp.]
MFQNPYASLNLRFTIGQTLVEPMEIHGIGKDHAERLARATALIQKVGLPEAALHKYPHEFSGGQRQRIAIARCLTLNPIRCWCWTRPCRRSMCRCRPRC